MLIWSSSSALLDIKMCFLRRWQKIGGLPSPPTHTHTQRGCGNPETLHSLRGKEGGQLDEMSPCGSRGWFFRRRRGEHASQRSLCIVKSSGGAAASVRAGGYCSIWHCLWTLGVLTMKNPTNKALGGDVRFSLCACQWLPRLEGARCAARTQSPHGRIASFPLPLCYPTPQILKQPKENLKTAKPFILVCYRDGQILQVELDVNFILDASTCQGKLQVCYVCLVCVASVEKNNSPLTAQSV